MLNGRKLYSANYRYLSGTCKVLLRTVKWCAFIPATTCLPPTPGVTVDVIYINQKSPVKLHNATIIGWSMVS